MSELKNLGTVVTSDVLIIGAGMSGVVAGLKLKQLQPDVDIVMIEKSYYGYNGQATRAGHGIVHMSPNDDLDLFCKEQVEENMYGIYLNDQEYLYDIEKGLYTYLAELEEFGAILTHNDDGSFHFHKEFPEKKCSSCNIDMDFTVPLAKNILAAGCRIYERVYFTDLLTNNGQVAGAVGFNLDTLEFIIFRAKAVILAANSFNPVIGGMFYSSALPTMAAFEVGAQLRNPEQATYYDLVYKDTFTVMNGVHWVMFNKHGENLFEKYNSKDKENVDAILLRGIVKEMREGNHPIYIDFSKLPETSQTKGEGFYQGNLMPHRRGINKIVHELMENAVEVDHERPLISFVPNIYSECLRTDIEAKTNVPGLWATGTITMYGASHGAWVHGDGLGYACRTGLNAGKSIASELADTKLLDVDIEQVKALKERVYAPFSFKGNDLPYKSIHRLYRTMCSPEYSIDKTEETIHEMLGIIKEARDNFEKNTYVPEGDGHHLSKAHELRTMFDMMEIMYMAYDMRKETRGAHYRSDYPERDDKNMLKWIVADIGEDGRPLLSWERIPFENYKFKPEGWEAYVE